MDDITEGDQERGLNPKILNGVGDTGRNDESSDHTLWNKDILNFLPITDADQSRPLHDDHLRSVGVIVVATHVAGLRDHNMHVPLAGETLRIERLEYTATTVLMNHDRFNPYTRRRLTSPHDRSPPP